MTIIGFFAFSGVVAFSLVALAQKLQMSPLLAMPTPLFLLFGLVLGGGPFLCAVLWALHSMRQRRRGHP
jgi:hypothetical protein